MSFKSFDDIAVWVDSVQAQQESKLYELDSLPTRQLTAFTPSPLIPPVVPCVAGDKEDPRPVRKR